MKTMANCGWLLGLLVVGCAAPASEPSPKVYGVAHPPTPAVTSTGSETHTMNAGPGRYLSVPGANNLRLSGFNTAPSPGSVAWSGVHGGTGNDYAYAVTADAATNLYVAGVVEANGDVGCGTHSTSTRAAFVARYSSEGVCQWATYIEGSDDVFASAIAYDSLSGNIYVGGGFTQDIFVGGNTKTSAGGYDGFLAKISNDGTTTSTVWTTTFGAASDEYVFSIAAGGSRVAVGGAFYDTTTFGGSSSATSQGDADAFIATYLDTTGAYDTSWTAGGASWDSVNSLAARPSGSGFAALGVYSGTADFGTGAGPVTSAGGDDGFIVNYDASLHPAAARSFGGTGDDSAHGLVVDASDNILVSGYFQSSIDLGNGAMTGDGSYSGFLAKYDSSLNLSSSTALTSTGMFIPEGIATDPTTGNTVLAGHYTGTATIGSMQYTPHGTVDAIVVGFDSTGAMTWSGTLGGTDATESLGVAVSSSGRVLVVGDYSADVDLDTGTVASSGGSDFFLLGIQD